MDGCMTVSQWGKSTSHMQYDLNNACYARFYWKAHHANPDPTFPLIYVAISRKNPVWLTSVAVATSPVEDRNVAGFLDISRRLHVKSRGRDAKITDPFGFEGLRWSPRQPPISQKYERGEARVRPETKYRSLLVTSVGLILVKHARDTVPQTRYGWKFEVSRAFLHIWPMEDYATAGRIE